MSSAGVNPDRFSERELEILRLLEQGLSDREMADKLILALSTVKWHNQQIFSKLGVNKRTLAIAQAKQMGLLDGAPAQPAARPTTRLPAQPTHFVGRKRELAEIRRQLQTARLLTLTGSPGTGKTRLALQAASEVAYEFRDGVYFVPLAPLTDPELIVDTIAGVLGVEKASVSSPIEALKLALRDKQLLLVLDNFEHLLPAAALVSDLLADAPDLTVLVTSRAVLHLYGEHELVVQPLALPEPETYADFAQYEAVELFVQQAQAVQAEFVLTPDNALDVAKICIRLDGLPLAIELAAARVKLFSPRDLLARMGSGLTTIASSRRDVAARHQTLTRTLDWSYDLLSAAEQQLFARLSVFAGGWTLDAAEAVCGGDFPDDLVETLASLVDKSLVRQDISAQHEIRFTLLKIIREYAAQRLHDSAEAEAVRQRHAAYYIDLAERVSVSLSGFNLVAWLNTLETEHDNFRAVLAWSLAGDPEPGLRLTHALGSCWRIRSHLVEGYQWSQKLLAKAGDTSPIVRSQALSTTSYLLGCILGNYEDARRMSTESLALARATGDRRAIAWACFALGNALESFDPSAAKTSLEEAAQHFRAVDERWGLARTLNSLGENARIEECYEQASALYEESLTLFRQLGNPWGENVVLQNIANVARNQGQLERARALFVQGLMTSQALNDRISLATSLDGLAGVLSLLGEPERAARLFGAADLIRERTVAHIQPGDLPDYERSLAATHRQLDAQRFDAAWAEGRAMTLDEALADAFRERAAE